MGEPLPEEEPPAERRHGLFVCLEGIDGAGKTTAVRAAGELLRNRGLRTVAFDKKDIGFGSSYVRRHLSELRSVIWGHPADDPYLELGDLHWVHLQAAWYHAVARCRVEPLVAAGYAVITDTWAFKFLAKLALRPSVDQDVARSAFAALPRPDLVIHLDIDPALAVARKSVVGRSETGGGEKATRADFVSYQGRLAAVLRRFAAENGWMTLPVSELGAGKVAEAVADAVAARCGRLVGGR